MNRRLCSSLPRPSRTAAEKTLMPRGLVPIQIEKHRAAREIIADVFLDILADSLKQRMSRRYPLSGRLLFQILFIEDDLFVFSAQVAQTEAPAVRRWATDSGVLDRCGTRRGRAAAPSW